jgi:hypothetical protein
VVSWATAAASLPGPLLTPAIGAVPTGDAAASARLVTWVVRRTTCGRLACWSVVASPASWPPELIATPVSPARDEATDEFEARLDEREDALKDREDAREDLQDAQEDAQKKREDNSGSGSDD